MTAQTVVDLITGPLGALVVLCVVVWGLYRELQAERARGEKREGQLDSLTESVGTVIEMMKMRDERERWRREEQ